MRRILKYQLKNLSKYAIKKHKIKIIVVHGWLGVEFVKEGIYQVLDEKFVVRRNVKPVWWDLSVPLNILGYEDKRRSIPGWISLTIRAIITLMISKSNPHYLVLSASSEHDSTAKYWSQFVQPEILVLFNIQDDCKLQQVLLNKTKQNKGTVIVDEKHKIKFPNKKIYSFGEKSKNINYKSDKNQIVITVKDKKFKFKNYGVSPYEPEFIASIFSTAKFLNLEINDIIGGFSKFDYRNLFLNKIKASLWSD